MGQISLNLPILNQPDTTEDVKLINGFTTIQTVINGNLDATNVSGSLAQSAAVNQSGQTVKGSSIVATGQNTSSSTYTTLSTPDQVTGIVLPSPGLIAVWYQATWVETVSAAAAAAIFIGANQLHLASGTANNPQAAIIGGTANVAVPLSTYAGGLRSQSASTGYPGDVTTGQVVGNVDGSNVLGAGACYSFAAAGAYTISVQFKASSGLVSVSSRRLYVQALSFT